MNDEWFRTCDIIYYCRIQHSGVPHSGSLPRRTAWVKFCGWNLYSFYDFFHPFQIYIEIFCFIFYHIAILWSKRDFSICLSIESVGIKSMDFPIFSSKNAFAQKIPRAFLGSFLSIFTRRSISLFLFAVPFACDHVSRICLIWCSRSSCCISLVCNVLMILFMDSLRE